jgi:hypothetical protein
MKWFKHKSDSWRDEALMKLRYESGLEGYGLYWMLVEMIAEKMDHTDRCELEMPVSFWASQTGVSVRKFGSLIKKMSDLSLISVISTGNILKIKIDNLLNNRDEHTKKLRSNSGVTPEQEGEGDIDKDINPSSRDKSLSEGEKPPPPKYAYQGQVIRLKQPDLEQWRRSFHAIPDIVASLSAKDAWLATQPTEKQKNWFTFCANQLAKDHNSFLEKRALGKQQKKGAIVLR